MRESTEKLYQMWTRIYHNYLGTEQPSRDNALKFLDFMKQEGKKNNTLAVIRNALVWKFGFRDLPAYKMELNEPKYISVAEVRKLIDNAPILEKTVITVLFDTCCRISEIMNLELKDIDWDHGIISVVRKGGSRELVKIDNRGVEALREWIKVRQSKNEKVFMDWDRDDMYRRITALGKRLGIKVTPHVLRHSRIMQLREAGVTDWGVLADIAGHKRIDTTKLIYGRLKAEDRGKFLEQGRW